MKYKWTNLWILLCLLLFIVGCGKKNALEAANTLETASKESSAPKAQSLPSALPTTAPEPLTLYIATSKALEPESESVSKHPEVTAPAPSKGTKNKSAPSQSSASQMTKSTKTIPQPAQTEFTTEKTSAAKTTTTDTIATTTTPDASTTAPPPESTIAPAKTSSFVSDLKTAESTDQLIVVIGQGGSKATVSYHQKSIDGIWTEIFSTTGVYGKNGAASDKKEGDGKTPIGCFTLTLAFGLMEDPGAKLPYHKIEAGDYWVDDSESPYYNQLVNTDLIKKDWSSAENMSEQSPYYNYALALNYNPDNTPEKGSAIFLHCTKSSKDSGSQGCVRIPEDYAKQLVMNVDSNTKIIIVSDKEQLSDY